MTQETDPLKTIAAEDDTLKNGFSTEVNEITSESAPAEKAEPVIEPTATEVGNLK